MILPTNLNSLSFDESSVVEEEEEEYNSNWEDRILGIKEKMSNVISSVVSV
jgi:hypothetical protein